MWPVFPLVLGLLALPAPAAAADRRPPVVATVYATREGLVGRTTANGHVIVERDHFVALPSRLGLSAKGGGERTVRVCASTGRCAFAPVWDVGPWNVSDDYWHAEGLRQSWPGLPLGRPEAQAAYQYGYNNGRDGFGRRVLNPAGIDLADGTFWDALGLTGNAWVTVAYLWTGGDGPRGRIDTGGGPLRVRAGPGTGHRVAGLAGEHAQVPIECQVPGERIAGQSGTTSLWDRVGDGMYVSHAYVAVEANTVPPRCG